MRLLIESWGKLAYFRLGRYTHPIWWTIISKKNTYQTKVSQTKLTTSRISLSSTLSSSDCNFSEWRKISRESAVISSRLGFCRLHLTFRLSDTPDILHAWSSREEGRVLFLNWGIDDWGNWGIGDWGNWEKGDGRYWEVGDWGRYGENSCALTTVRESKNRCRINAMLASSVEDPTVIISDLIALLYVFEYASVRTGQNIKYIKQSKSCVNSHTWN